MDNTTVSQHLTLHLLSTDGHVLPLTAELYYDATDPLAVTALFDDGGDSPVRWIFARELLEAGLDKMSGDGDVVIWPTQTVEGTDAIHIRLCSPHGDALLEADSDALEFFLAATWQLVPPGTEVERLDLDELVDALLADG